MQYSLTRHLLSPILLLALTGGSFAAEEEETAAVDPAQVVFKARVKQITAQLDAVYGEGFFAYLCDDGIVPLPYLIAYEYKPNIDRETIAESYGEIFGNLYRVFYEEFGELLELEPVKEPIVVLIYDSKESYKEMREAKPELHLPNEEFMGGYYQPGSGILTQWRQSNLWETMFHEGTHQLIDYATRKWNVPQTNESPWIQEGFADFMGGHERKQSYSEEEGGFVKEFTLGQFIGHRYTSVQQALLSGDGYSLKDLVHLDFFAFKMAQNSQEGQGENQRLTGYVYAQGWALVMFLNYYQDGIYKDLFSEYLRAEVRGEGGGVKFGEIFMLEEDEDWEAMEDEFKEFVFGELRTMGKKQKK